ncbi:MAG: OmpA family protein [Methylotenera sp.]|nr:OmpA family protein [Oligoflexia bacterium]
MALSKLFRSKRNSEEQYEYRRPDDSMQGRPPAHSDDESNWLVSYADMMTLLCGFFIMLFSMAKLDAPQYEKVKESVAKSFKGEYKNPSQEFARFLTQVIQEAGVEKEAAIRNDSSGVSLVFQSATFFDTLSAEIKPEGQKVLSQLMNGITMRQQLDNKKFKIVVEGHTDSRQILGGAYASNWELSGARASQVVRMFVDKGFNPQNLVAIGYADTRPDSPTTADPGSATADATPRRQPAETEESHARNRRVVIRILDAKADSIPLPADSAYPAAPATSAH